MSEDYYSIQTATKKLNKSAKAVRNYADLGYIDTEDREGKTYYNTDRLTKQRAVNHHAVKDSQYLKPMFELIEILSKYFPVEFLDSDEYDKLHDELLEYEKRCERLGEKK